MFEIEELEGDKKLFGVIEIMNMVWKNRSIIRRIPRLVSSIHKKADEFMNVNKDLYNSILISTLNSICKKCRRI
jgi:hypothetical protein